jgi:protein-S-isoprenylcysteine O-methyltransferase Ste14
MAAFALFVTAHALQIWAMAVNAFFSTALRLQAERGHHVVRNGPYRYVRHPGYLAMLLIVPSTAIALDSKLALLPAAIYEALILFRAGREDRYLLRNLPGYADYMQWAPYRLIPGIW